MIVFKMLILILMFEEGFSPVVYKDSLGYDTIGYGTRWYEGDKDRYTREEAFVKLRGALADLVVNLSKDDIIGPVFRETSIEGKMVLSLMAYQMGLSGLKEFELFLSALSKGDIEEAQHEMLDSLWGRKQTPSRAMRTAYLLTTSYKIVYKRKF